MNLHAEKTAIPALRWTLGLVLLVQSYQFAFSSSAHHFAGGVLPPWLPLALGGSEIIAALLFLLPATTIVGGYLLLAIFALAILIHSLHGDFQVGGLLVYAAAVFVCMAQRSRETTEFAHD